MAVYLLHFHDHYKQAGHYLGYAEDVQARFEQHRTGRGGRLCAVAVAAGCTLELVRVWEDGDRTMERRLKQRKDARSLCPICQAERRARSNEQRRARRARKETD